MNVWQSQKWKDYYTNMHHRTGIKIDYEVGVDLEVKRACKEFITWIRKNYIFPKRIRVYVKERRRIKTSDGDRVCGLFFKPNSKDDEPYICIATGDYDELLIQGGKDNALASILWCLAHEMTHYFQWINDITLTKRGMELQATYYADEIMSEYSMTRDHP